jgi:hypothetical protein
MYDPATTRRFLAAQARATPSFDPTYLEAADVAHMTGILADAWDPETKDLTRGLTPDEIAFIDHERLICTHDFRYWATRYAKIVSFEKVLTPFRPNAAQEIVLDLWAEMDAKRWAIMMIQLKARQLGVSTLTELAVAHRVQFWADVDAVVASSTPIKTEKLSKMIRTVWEHTPWWLMPRVTKVSKLMPAEFGGHNSALDCSQSGNQFSGVSRGSTPNVAHFSELCEWSNPAEDIDASFLNAVHETPYVFAILESTALGRDNWWHAKWRLSKEGWARGRARLCPIFLPWYVGRDIYPDEGWLRKHPIPPDWRADEPLQLYAARAAAYVEANPRLRQHLGRGWVLPREQLWWYEVTRDEYKQSNELNRFLQECPADDFEAFQSTNHSVFSVEVVTRCREQVKEPIGVYKLQGFGPAREDVPIEHRPTSVETESRLPPIPIRAQWGAHDLRYELVPVRYDGYGASTDGKIFVWEWPAPDEEYGFGVDTGDGIGLDASVIEGLRKGSLTRIDGQVVEMCSPYINSQGFWPWAYALGSLFATEIDGERRQPRVSIDCLRSGEAVQYEMKKRGWWNFHVWQRYDQRMQRTRSNKIGFFSNQWARAWMLDMVQTYINNGWIDLASPMFVAEMESLEKDEAAQSARAAYGGHDDRIVAAGMLLFSWYVNETRGPRQTATDRRTTLAREDPVWDPGWQGRDVSPHGMPPRFDAVYAQVAREARRRWRRGA